MKNFFAHKKALVETEDIGTGTRIWAFVHILAGARIGRRANICDYCFIEGDVTIGDDVTIKSGVYLWNGLRIEDKVFIGPAAVFTNDVRPRSKNRKFLRESTLLKEGCSVGANATVLAGCVIGCYSMIGAGAVVTKDVPDYGLVYGNPARLKGYVCMCGNKLQFKNKSGACKCGQKFLRSGKTQLKLVNGAR